PALRLFSVTILLGNAASSVAAPTFSNGVNAGNVSVSGLVECSGIVASRNNANVLWVHNDSNDSARLFALDTQGRRLGTYNLTGASHTDYEDIGIGPGPLTNISYLYVGDIGDNGESRSNIRVYQIPEPAVYSRQYTNAPTVGVKGVHAITLNYPDSPHNAESLFIDPWTGDLFIVTKESTTSRVYSTTQAALNSGTNVILTFVRNLTFNIPSAADISPSGREIIIRQEEFARLWTRTNGQSISNALATAPVTIPVIGTPTEPNGEAVAFDANGNGYYTLSENASTEPLYYFARTSGDGNRLPQSIIPAGATWKYRDNGSNQGTAWREPAFDDSAWSNGIAQLGYGNGDEKTIVSYGANANNKHVTTYFRKQFVVDNAPCLESLTLKLVMDDGAAVYLNGTNILNYQLATNAAYNTLASTVQATNVEDTWFSFPVNPALLFNGTNTLAVEIHQAAVNSPDISFDLQLIGMESTTPRFMSYGLGTNRFELQLCGPSTTNITVQATTNFNSWTNVGSVILTNGLGSVSDLQTTNFPQRFYRAVR
ncbi:MAG: hypothetical protein AAB370_03020, partial [Verrucomicrobiota bacterium]